MILKILNKVWISGWKWWTLILLIISFRCHYLFHGIDLLAVNLDSFVDCKIYFMYIGYFIFASMWLWVSVFKWRCGVPNIPRIVVLTKNNFSAIGKDSETLQKRIIFEWEEGIVLRLIRWKKWSVRVYRTVEIRLSANAAPKRRRRIAYLGKLQRRTGTDKWVIILETVIMRLDNGKESMFTSNKRITLQKINS